MSSSGGIVPRQKGITLRRSVTRSQPKTPVTTIPAVYSLANAQPQANPANSSDLRQAIQFRPLALARGVLAGRGATQNSAMLISPTTSACENMTVLYTNGIPPKNSPNVVTTAERGRTQRHSHRNRQTAPSAAGSPSAPAQAIQLVASQLSRESADTP